MLTTKSEEEFTIHQRHGTRRTEVWQGGRYVGFIHPATDELVAIDPKDYFNVALSVNGIRELLRGSTCDPSN